MYRDEWPHVLSLSGDGSVLAVGYPSDNICRVHEWKSGNWTQRGGDIAQVTQATGSDYFGITISISSDGTILAIGAIFNDGNGSSSGSVRVYQFNDTENSWNQMGDDINGVAAGDFLGYSVCKVRGRGSCILHVERMSSSLVVWS